MGSISHIAPLFILGLSCALIGWAVMVVASQIERRRRERHAERIPDDQPRLTQPPWIQVLRSWLLP